MPVSSSIPIIPDHEVLRIIGRGAYGEIWLAQSITGSWRAAKIVSRSTFESERAFNREFEGMARFEPISRAHRGFVNILHVGRNTEQGFFYYLMELADDQSGSEPVDLQNYTPKTLKSELQHRRRLPVSECIELGLSLSDALAALHARGLTHRDIKPANIIFVQGDPKLADIGLVAASGQHSFVGTEGYVPPEGPGTPQADLFSLGKVLYEISMGKDRLDFPEVVSDASALEVDLLRLNEVLLKSCARDPRKRYQHAAEMHVDLLRLKKGRRCTTNLLPRWLWFGAAAALFLSVLMIATLLFRAPEQTDAPKLPGRLEISTVPNDAMIVLDDQMRRSPAVFEKLAPGKHLLRVMKAGFEPVEREIEIADGQSLPLPQISLTRRHGGINLKSEPAGADYKLEIIDPKEKFSRAGTTPARLTNIPTGIYQLAVIRDDRVQTEQIEIRANEMLLKTIEFANGSVKITSAPGGAAVFRDGKELGHTPLLLEDVPPGPVEFELRLDGFEPVKVSATVTPKQQEFLSARFARRHGPQRGKPWENSLGMKFLPVGDILFCIWETRVQDWLAYCQAAGVQYQPPNFPQDSNHPIIKVNRADAEAFCEWLSQRERNANQLALGQFYRLPTDGEWSMAAGLTAETGATPEARDGKIKDHFPWGKQWPPPSGAGNYASASFAKISSDGALQNYDDGFEQLAPVGSFNPNHLGLHDLGGNVWEWCGEGYKNTGRYKDWGVLRGASWANSNRAELLTSYRNVIDPAERDVLYGFRVVLVPE